MTLRIVKAGYSRSPWRIVSDQGKELSCTLRDASGNVMCASAPVCGNTKQEVVDFALRQLEQLYADNADLRKSRDNWQCVADGSLREGDFNVCA